MKTRTKRWWIRWTVTKHIHTYKKELIPQDDESVAWMIKCEPKIKRDQKLVVQLQVCPECRCCHTEQTNQSRLQETKNRIPMKMNMEELEIYQLPSSSDLNVIHGKVRWERIQFLMNVRIGDCGHGMTRRHEVEVTSARRRRRRPPPPLLGVVGPTCIHLISGLASRVL